MGVETIPVLQGHDAMEFYLWPVEWKWMTDCVEGLEDLAKQLSLTPLSGFLTYARQDVIENLSEEEVEEAEDEAELRDGWYYLGDDRLWSVERQWYDSKQGLGTVRKLLSHLKAHPDAVEDSDDAEAYVYILEELEKALAIAAEEGTSFHLKMCI